MAVAASNAGRGRVDKWVAPYGDAVDWVARSRLRKLATMSGARWRMVRSRIDDSARVPEPALSGCGGPPTGGAKDQRRSRKAHAQADIG